MFSPTIEWIDNKVRLIDQTRLPREFVQIYCETPEQMHDAIKRLCVRGAPAIGIAGAFGVVLGVQHSKAGTYAEFEKEFRGVVEYLGTSRPTAVNLFWAMERMARVLKESKDKSISELKDLLLKEALAIFEEDKRICRDMAEFGASLIEDGDIILTHCNAGALATADYGTALGVLYRAKEQGKEIKVYADETRPLLQGARLTVWELMQRDIDVTLICDNVAASLMRQGRITKVIVGADRIASNGDTANKIGTYSIAVNAKYHNIPFYVAAPISTIDTNIPDGSHIPIEERAKEEVTNLSVKVYNPAFDVTPNNLITAIVTEKGILVPPYEEAIGGIFSDRDLKTLPPRHKGTK